MADGSVLPGIISGIIGGSCTLLAAGIITQSFQRSMKRADFFLSFNARYHQLMDKKFHSGSNFSAASAERFYHEFFDLMGDQFVSFRLGYVNPEFFTGWTIWRHYQYRDSSFKVHGVSYSDGWESWCDAIPRDEYEFVQFMRQVHACQNEEDVRRVVRWWGSRSKLLAHFLAWLGTRNELVLGALVATALWIVVLLATRMK